MDPDRAEYWMREALKEAGKAEEEGEVPIGAILLLDGNVIGRAHNAPIQSRDPTAHAEILALRQGARQCSNYRLPGSVLVVTVEPCVMCVGAMIHARVGELIYGAADPKAGAVVSRFQLASNPLLNHRMQVTGGILGEECGLILARFFAARRRTK